MAAYTFYPLSIVWLGAAALFAYIGLLGVGAFMAAVWVVVVLASLIAALRRPK